MTFRALDRKQVDVPDDVYVQFVRSLFDNGLILLVGGICYSIVVLSVYYTTGNPIYIGFAALLLAVNSWRYQGIRDFFRNGGMLRDADDARRWERRYVFRGCFQGLSLGALSVVAIYIYPNTHAELASLLLILASLITVVSRNYGSPWMVRIFTATFIAPPAIALLLTMNPASTVLGLLIVPMTWITISSASHLRKILFSAVIGHRNANQLAHRFDRALNTMPQGLLMFDRTGRVIVANAEAAHFLRLRNVEQLIGRSMEAILLRIVAAGLLDKQQRSYAVRQLTGALREGFDRKLILELTDARSFELSTREGDQSIGVVMFEDVTARVVGEKRIIAMARYDNLTGLPNRTYMHELISARLDAGDPSRICALAIFDLDEFKSINDTLGHPYGDAVIRVLGDRIAPFASDKVIIGRFGGDEFLIYCDDIGSREQAGALVSDVRNALGHPVEVDENRQRVTASGGVVVCGAGEAKIDNLIVRADLALSHAKEKAVGWRLFEDKMEEAFRNRQRLKVELRAAVERGNLRIVYQPIISLATMKIASCEALCRWDHPELGAVSPAQFIPLAEEMGIIADITTFMLNAACRDCATWPTQINLSVNLSARDIANADIVDKVRSAIEMSGIAPERLDLEVTETSLLDYRSGAHRYIDEIRESGVHIALDDFGTGYSSLSYLNRLPLDKIKIDRSFLADIMENQRSLILLSETVNLARRLGKEVTVEGVETYQQLELLAREVKPDLLQGFLFGSALTSAGIKTMSTSSFPFGPADDGKVTPIRKRAAAINVKN